MQVAQAQEDPGMFDVSIPEGKYECLEIGPNRKTQDSFYLYANGTYERIDGQKGQYTYMPDVDSPETIMYITWVSGPNKRWDKTFFVNLQEPPRINLFVSTPKADPATERHCYLVR